MFEAVNDILMSGHYVVVAMFAIMYRWYKSLRLSMIT